MTSQHRAMQTALVVALVLAACGPVGGAAAPRADARPDIVLADVRLGDHQGYTRVVLEFERVGADAPTDELPRFETRYVRYPYRLEVDLFGVRAAATDFAKASADRSKVVTSVGVHGDVGERMATRAVICLERPSRYRIRIFPDPLRLIFDLRPERRDRPPARVWAVCVATQQPDLSRLARAGVEPSWLSLIPDAAGGTAVEAGAFADKEAAAGRAHALAALGVSASVVERGPADLPEPCGTPETPPVG